MNVTSYCADKTEKTKKTRPKTEKRLLAQNKDEREINFGKTRTNTNKMIKSSNSLYQFSFSFA